MRSGKKVPHEAKGAGEQTPAFVLESSICCWRALFRIVVIFSHSILLHVYALPFLPAYWLAPSLWRAVGDACQRSWSAWVLWWLPRIRLVVDQDAAADDDDRPTLMVMNHQIDTDWVLALALAETRCAGRLKIALKRDIQSIPVMGTGAMMFGFVFLSRRWEEDRHSMAKQLGSLLSTMAEPMWLLIFPEGTTIHTEAVAKSRRFAATCTPPRPQFTNLLLPRTTGTTFALSMMKEAAAQQGLKAPRVLDLTVAYAGYRGEVPTYAQGYGRASDVEVPNMLGLLDTPFTRELTVHISAREVSLTDAEAESGDWLDRCWERKERLLEAFKSEQAFPKEASEAKRTTFVARPSSLATASWPVWIAALGVVAAASLQWRLRR